MNHLKSKEKFYLVLDHELERKSKDLTHHLIVFIINAKIVGRRLNCNNWFGITLKAPKI